MPELDHRPFTIPLFTLGAVLLAGGAIGLVVDATTDLQTINPGGAAAAGAILVFAAFAVAALLNPASAVSQQRARTIPGVAAFALVVILVAAIAGGAALGSATDRASTDTLGAGTASATAAAEGLLDVEEVTGELQGAAAPGPLGAVGGASGSSASHEIAMPSGATSLRVELHWSPDGAGGASSLDLRVETPEGEVLASASGAPGLTLDVAVADLASQDIVLIVALPQGGASAGQAYTAYVSSFAGSIPAGHTAHAE